MTLLYLVAAWMAGVLIAGQAQGSAAAWLAGAAIAVGLAVAAQQERRWRLVFVCAACFALGAARMTVAARPPGPDHVGHYVGSGAMSLIGTISRPPDPRDTTTNLRLDVERIEDRQGARPVTGTILVQAPRYGAYGYGDRITVRGLLLSPPEFDGFSYRDYLARQGVHGIVANADVEVLSTGGGLPWLRAIYAVREQARDVVNRLLPSPQAPLLNGILLGDESAISATVRDAFQRTGTSHVIAISGANIVVIIRVLMGLLQPGLGRRRAAWVTLVAVAVYTVLVGATASVVRAALMGGLAIVAAQTGRRVHGLTTLAFAAWLMTLWNPFTAWDIGFQLSVAATAGLVLFSHDFEHGLEALLRRLLRAETARRVTRWLSEPVAVSLAAQVATLPLTVLYFGQLSIASLLANALIVPLQPFVMIFGGLAAIAGLVVTPLGQLFAWVAWLPLTGTLAVVRGLARLNAAAIPFQVAPGAAWTALAVISAVGLLRLQHPDDRAVLLGRLRRHVSTAGLMGVGAVLTLLVWAVALTLPDGVLHVWFLDVGHGNAILIQTPKGAQILVDGGPNPKELRRAVGDALPFWDRTLDLLVVTQPAHSTVNALPALLDTYSVQAVLTNGHGSDDAAYRALVDRLAVQGAAVLPAWAGYRAEVGDGVMLEVLHPFGPDQMGEGDAVALVLRLTYGEATFLLAPDLAASAQRALLTGSVDLNATVSTLIAHGDAALNGSTYLDRVRPQAAVVMVGAGQHNLPARSALEAAQIATGRAIYRTDQDGTVEFRTDGTLLEVVTER